MASQSTEQGRRAVSSLPGAIDQVRGLVKGACKRPRTVISQASGGRRAALQCELRASAGNLPVIPAPGSGSQKPGNSGKFWCEYDRPTVITASLRIRRPTSRSGLRFVLIGGVQVFVPFYRCVGRCLAPGAPSIAWLGSRNHNATIGSVHCGTCLKDRCRLGAFECAPEDFTSGHRHQRIGVWRRRTNWPSTGCSRCASHAISPRHVSRNCRSPDSASRRSPRNTLFANDGISRRCRSALHGAPGNATRSPLQASRCRLSP